jgi:hypothetical protein
MAEWLVIAWRADERAFELDPGALFLSDSGYIKFIKFQKT